MFPRLLQVLEVKIITDRATGVSRGFAFVTMHSAAAAQAALAALNNNYRIDGRTIQARGAGSCVLRFSCSCVLRFLPEQVTAMQQLSNRLQLQRQRAFARHAPRVPRQHVPCAAVLPSAPSLCVASASPLDAFVLHRHGRACPGAKQQLSQRTVYTYVTFRVDSTIKLLILLLRR